METTQGVTSKQSLILDIEVRDIVRVLVAGAVLGLVAWGLTLLLNQFVFTPIMCHNEGIKCAQSSGYSMVSAQIITAIIGLVALVNIRAYRPLLVVIAASLALWNVATIFNGWAVAVASVILFAISYTLFALIARFRSFTLAIVIMLVLIVMIRLAIIS